MFSSFGARQLWLINQLYTHYATIDLYHARPLYAFSAVTARTALSIAVVSYAWVVAAPGEVASGQNLAVAILYTVVALAIFVWPLLGLHMLLRTEKNRLQDDAASHMIKVTADLHQHIDAQNLDNVTNIKLTIVSLTLEKNDLEKMSTWPWQADTARWLLTALALPIILWIIQKLLEKLPVF